MSITSYEWVVEELDKYGDIIDPLYSDKFIDVMNWSKDMDNYEIALVKRIGSDEESELDRQYAYLKNN